MNDEKKSKLALLEAILFTTSEPLTIEEISRNIKSRKESVEKLIAILRKKYENSDSGITLSEGAGFKLMVKADFAERVSHLTPHADLSRGLLRVLSIIAYHDPINQSEIVKVIGNRTYDYVKELESRGLIKTEKKSRTKMLSTTPQFEEYFGVKKHLLKKEFEKEDEEKEEDGVENKHHVREGKYEDEESNDEHGNKDGPE